jgi:dihydrofolate reductase
VIGLNGGMPWQLSSDLRRFKALTMGGTLVMGRKTFDTIGKPLPGRVTIVLSRSPHVEPKSLSSAEVNTPGKANLSPEPSLYWATSVGEVIRLAGQFTRPTFILGGAEVYRLFFPFCDNIFLTRVMSAVEGDTRIDLPLDEFELLSSNNYPKSDRDSDPTEFQHWQRKKIPCQKGSVPIE